MSWLLHLDCETRSVDLLSSQLWDLGTTGIAELGNGVVVAGFDTQVEANQARLVLGHGTVSEYDPAIVPTPAPTKVSFGKSTIELVETSVFGHGAHETTRLALDALEQIALDGLIVLDFGCGTGVLAIAASLGGAAVTAVDNDPAAVQATVVNAATNKSDIAVAGEVPDQVFDVVVANMLLADLQTIAGSIRSSLAYGGTLITTGFLRDQGDQVLDLFPDLTLARSASKGEWTLLELSA